MEHVKFDITDLFPNAEFGTDNEGQIIIYTGVYEEA